MAHKVQFTCDRCNEVITDDLLKSNSMGELTIYNECPAVKIPRPQRALGSEEVVYVQMILMDFPKQYMTAVRKVELCRACRATLMRDAADALEKNGAVKERRPSEDDN